MVAVPAQPRGHIAERRAIAKHDRGFAVPCFPEKQKRIFKKKNQLKKPKPVGKNADADTVRNDVAPWAGDDAFEPPFSIRRYSAMVELTPTVFRPFAVAWREIGLPDE